MVHALSANASGGNTQAHLYHHYRQDDKPISTIRTTHYEAFYDQDSLNSPHDHPHEIQALNIAH